MRGDSALGAYGARTQQGRVRDSEILSRQTYPLAKKKKKKKKKPQDLGRHKTFNG